MKIPFIVQTAGSLIGAAVLVGIAYQSLAASDAHQSAQIEKIATHQEVAAEKVNAIQIDIARLVVIQESTKSDILRLLEEILSKD